MAPARVETFVYDHYKMMGKAVQEKNFVVQTKRSTGLSAEILDIRSNSEFTCIKMRKRLIRDIDTEGEVDIEKGVDMIKPTPRHLPQERPYLLITLRGEGSSMRYRPSFGSLKPLRRPDVVKITHTSQR